MIPVFRVLTRGGKFRKIDRVLGRLPVGGGIMLLLIIMTICWIVTICQSLCDLRILEMSLLACHPYISLCVESGSSTHRQLFLNGPVGSNYVLHLSLWGTAPDQVQCHHLGVSGPALVDEVGQSALLSLGT